MTEQRPSKEIVGLLVDMRRKYLHAKQMGNDPDWLKGEPITAQLLERWIPIAERAANEIERLNSDLAWIRRRTGFWGEVPQTTPSDKREAPHCPTCGCGLPHNAFISGNQVMGWRPSDFVQAVEATRFIMAPAEEGKPAFEQIGERMYIARGDEGAKQAYAWPRPIIVIPTIETIRAAQPPRDGWDANGSPTTEQP
jgi:hypothetical protein